MTYDKSGSAFPEVATDCDQRDPSNDYYPNTYSYGGMTKREYFAAKALQGLLANPLMGTPPANGGVIEVLAVEIADALIAELSKKKTVKEGV